MPSHGRHGTQITLIHYRSRARHSKVSKWHVPENIGTRHLRFLSLLGTGAFRRLDEAVQNEVAPYVSTINALPISIQNQARIAADQDPTDFLEELKKAWKAHNELATELSTFLYDLYSGRTHWMSSEIVVTAQALLDRAFDTEDRKRIYSAGVKLALERHIDTCKQRFRLTKDDVTLLLSCWRPDFWSYRLGVHARLCLIERSAGGPNVELRERVARDLHGGETLLLEERLTRPPLKSLGPMSGQELSNIVRKMDEIEKRTREFSHRGCYLIMGRPILKAIQGIIQYDNFYEHLFGYNRYGIPDFFFRKEVCWLLQRRGLLENKPSVVFYCRDELLNGLRALKSVDGKTKLNNSRLGAAGIFANTGDDLWGRMLHDDGFRIFSRPTELGSGGSDKKASQAERL